MLILISVLLSSMLAPMTWAGVGTSRANLLVMRELALLAASSALLSPNACALKKELGSLLESCKTTISSKVVVV